jgi:DNA-directed RNA polymerase specialized sigma24 family protein
MGALPTTDADFAALAERHRRELHVHCYRMLTSFEKAEDLVQRMTVRAELTFLQPSRLTADIN